MKFANTKISAELFASRYPYLFSLYQRLMQVTQARYTARRNQSTAGFDAEVNDALGVCRLAEEAARRAFRDNVAGYVDALNAEVRAADAELNLTLERLLAEKDEADRHYRDNEQAELRNLESRLRAAQECCRELELVEKSQELFEQFQQDVSDVQARFSPRHLPVQQHYQGQVQSAFDARNERVRIANSSYQAAIDPHYLMEKRALRDAATTKDASLRRIAWRRGEESEALAQWWSGVKQERLYLIESFLQDPCLMTLQKQLYDAIEEMSATGADSVTGADNTTGN